MVRRQVTPAGTNPYTPGGAAAEPDYSGMTKKEIKAAKKAEADRAAQLKKFEQEHRTESGVIYYGVEGGSDWENMGVTREQPLVGPFQRAKYAGMAGANRPGPRYKVGYINSEQFLKEDLLERNPEVIETYQKFMYDAGLLKKYQPGEMDKWTKAAFKELMISANQTGKTWQSVLGEAINNPVVGEGQKEEEVFQAKLDDPVALRETFQKSVRDIYGGDLPDDEVNAMVDAYRSTQLAKARAAFDLGVSGTEGTVDEMTDPTSYAEAAVKAKHPQQVDRVKFADTFSGIMDTFRGGAQ